MMRRLALALAALPLAFSPVAAVPAAAQRADPIAQVSTHLRAIDTMMANFTQTDRRGQTLRGTLAVKRPGKLRFAYQAGVPFLIVADGDTLRMIDYEVKQVTPLPFRNSPLSVLIDPRRSLKGIATVVTNTDKVLVVRARDRKGAEWGTTTLAFARVPSAPGGLLLQGWTALDAQNNVTTIKLSNQRFNRPVADSVFHWADPRKS